MSRIYQQMKPVKGFTLIELLVVVAVIGVLAAVSWVVLNPPEIIKKAHDADRLVDMSDLRQAVMSATVEATGSASQVLCNGAASPCGGFSHKDTRFANGTGWVKVDLTVQKSVSLPALPVDPVNDDTYHYVYCANNDDWELATRLESSQQVAKMTGDGGSVDSLYEVGTNLNLISLSDGACTY